MEAVTPGSTPAVAPVAAPAAPTGDVQAGDIKAAAAEAVRKLKIKHDDGREEEVDEDEVLKTYRDRKRHQQVASRELNEGKQLRKQAEQFVEMMKDPEKLWEVARKLGHDPRKLSEAQLSRVLEDELMDPKDKELREHRAKLSEYERKEKEAEESSKKKRMEELGDKYRKQFEVEFVEALKTTEVPQTKETVARMARYMQMSAKNNIDPPLSAKEAAELVRQDIQDEQTRIVRQLDGPALLKLFGPEVANKIREYDTSQLKNPASALTTPVEQTRREKPSDKRPTSREWQLKKRGLI